MTADTITAIKKAGIRDIIVEVLREHDEVRNIGRLADALEKALESLQRENEELRKDRYDLAYAITGGEDAPGLLDSTPTSEIVEIAQHAHRWHHADIDRAMAAEAEVKRYRAALSEIATNEEYRILTAEEAQTVAQKAPASTGGENHADK